MGNRAKLRADARKRAKEHRAMIRADHERIMALPGVQKAQETPQDEATIKLSQAALPAQRARLAAEGWYCRIEGETGAGLWDHIRKRMRIIHSVARQDDGRVWSHMSVSLENGTMPEWYQVRDCHWVLYPERTGIIVVASEDEHFSLSEVAHVWTCLSDEVLPDFRFFGQV